MRVHLKRIAPVAALALTVFACEEGGVEDRAVDSELTVPTSALALTSASGCMLDEDCDTGLFCFQSQCSWECDDATPCAEDAFCSDNGRCLDTELAEARADFEATGGPNSAIGAGDEDRVASAAVQQVNVSVLQAPSAEVEVDIGQPFVEVTLQTDKPVPGGALLYRIESDGAVAVPQAEQALGTDTFTFQIPTGTAGGLGDAPPSVQRLTLVTAVGGFSIALVPRRGVNGVYAGEVRVREFGGSSIPVLFALRVEPPDATFAEADERFIMLSSTARSVFAPGQWDGDPWIERPMELDAQSGVWFARYAHEFAPTDESMFAGREQIVRAMRIEIENVDEEGVEGALADRWLGLYDARSADGVVTPASVVLSGRMSANRVGPLDAEMVNAIAGEGTADRPTIGDIIAITECTDALYASMVTTARLTQADACLGAAQRAQFEAIDSSARARCALSLGEVALAGETTAAQVRAFLDDDSPNPGGLSFGEFLERCAEMDGYCSPTPELLCAGNVLAAAYQSQDSELPEAGALISMYQDVAREGYLGRQLAAFQVDTQLRLDWLRTSIAPLFLAAALRDFNEGILERWEDQVLDAHFDVLATQFAPSGLETLARTPTDAEALAVRRTFLLEQTQTWQGAMSALEIAATRWNAVHQNDIKRAQATQAVQRRMFDLYLSAAVLSELSRTSGSAGTNSAFGSGFAALLRSLEQLSLPFSDLIFMRDAEVVVSRSVDPSSDSQTLLGDLENIARTAVADAQRSVDRVLEDVQDDTLNAQVLTDRLATQAEEFAAELVSLCGLPVGCSPLDVGIREECEVDVAVGRCGFFINAGSNEFGGFDDMLAAENVSEAGEAMLRMRAAVLDVQIANEAFRANQEETRILLETADAFADQLTRWNVQRRTVDQEVNRMLDEMTTIGTVLAADEMIALNEQQALRNQAYNRQEQQLARWSTVAYAGVTADMRTMTTINALSQTASWLTLTGNEVDRLAAATADGLPKAAGASNDVSAPARFAIKLSAYGATTAMRAVSQGLQTAADSIGLTLAEQQARREVELQDLDNLAALDAQLTENELEQIAINMRAREQIAQTAIATREALIDAMQRSLELDLAYDRDLVELRDRRDRVQVALADAMRLRLDILRAEVVALRHQQQYMQVVQRAQLLDGRYRSLLERLNNLDILIASPSVIFAFANRLQRAEARIERAKTLLYDWVVALEYYAVRPFIDQRLAILLARNPSQLEAIANELVRLQRVCGGNVNYEVLDLSVRDDLLAQGFSTSMGADTVDLGAGSRFRSILARGNVPVSTRIRYSTDERIGDVIGSRDVLAASFSIRLEDFANLPLTCNAKIASIDVQLVGEGLGNARPTVSILYDGSSTLRSCQPNIEAIVGGLEPGTTSFGPVTSLRTAGRSVSPVAGVNSFGLGDSANRGLEGLPLSSTYTILIDPEQGENAFIDWSQLDDIQLRVTYAYQDLFAEGQCE